jgi:hypothetical protein
MYLVLDHISLSYTVIVLYYFTITYCKSIEHAPKTVLLLFYYCYYV